MRLTGRIPSNLYTCSRVLLFYCLQGSVSGGGVAVRVLAKQGRALLSRGGGEGGREHEWPLLCLNTRCCSRSLFSLPPLTPFHPLPHSWPSLTHQPHSVCGVLRHFKCLITGWSLKVAQERHDWAAGVWVGNSSLQGQHVHVYVYSQEMSTCSARTTWRTHTLSHPARNNNTQCNTPRDLPDHLLPPSHTLLTPAPTHTPTHPHLPHTHTHAHMVGCPIPILNQRRHA